MRLATETYLSVVTHAISAVFTLPAPPVARAAVASVEEDVYALPPAAGFTVPAPLPAAPAVDGVRPEVHAALLAAVPAWAAANPADLWNPVAGHGGLTITVAEQAPEGEFLFCFVWCPHAAFFVVFCNLGDGISYQ